MAFSADGKSVMTSSPTGLFSIDLTTGESRLLAPVERVLGIALSPDGRLLAAGSRWGEVTLCDVATGETRALAPEPNEESVRTVAFSRDGTILCAGSDASTILRWDVASGAALEPLSHKGLIMTVAFSPDGRLMASSSFEGNTCLWDVPTWSLVGTLESGNIVVPCVSFSPDGKTVVTTEAYGATIWDVASQREVGTIPSINVGSVILTGLTQWSPDGRTLATRQSGSRVTLHDIVDHSDRVLGHHAVSATAVAFSHDGRSLDVGFDDGVVRRWDLTSGAMRRDVGPVTSIRPSSPPDRVAASPVGDLRAVATSQDVRLLQGDGDVVAELRANEGSIICLAFSPDGSLFAFGSTGGALRVYEVATGALRETGRMHAHGVRSLAFSPSGEHLATAAGDGTIRLWRPATLERLVALRAVEPDASYAFTEGPEGRVEFFGEAARACVYVAEGPFRRPIDVAAADFVVEGLVPTALGFRSS